jgi:hypothetical protein
MLGLPYRGQPSVLYRVPFTISLGDSSGATGSYAGYSDISGATGTLFPPDPTQITEDTPGTGAQRLQLITGTTDRVEVTAKVENDTTPPAMPGGISTADVTQAGLTLRFTAPGDDGLLGSVSGYDVRYRTDPMTPQNFDDPTTSKALATYVPVPAGTPQTIQITGLLPDTMYWVGVRAYDDCRNNSEVAIVQVTTAKPVGAYVDACFVATAAYGTAMAGDVESLRSFRDVFLRSNVLGELAVEAYYTFGPPVAGVVGGSELLRQLSRDLLFPIVARVRQLGG